MVDFTMEKEESLIQEAENKALALLQAAEVKARNLIYKDHEERIKHIEMAMFGDELFPDTVKNAILPTMTRLNIWLDMIGTVWRVGLGAAGGLAALAVFAKALGWI